MDEEFRSFIISELEDFDFNKNADMGAYVDRIIDGCNQHAANKLKCQKSEKEIITNYLRMCIRNV